MRRRGAVFLFCRSVLFGGRDDPGEFFSSFLGKTVWCTVAAGRMKIVVKVGTGVLTRENGTLDGSSIVHLVSALADLMRRATRWCW